MCTNRAAYDPTIFNTLLSSGKTNLKKICSWKLTTTDILDSAILVANVSSSVQTNLSLSSTIDAHLHSLASPSSNISSSSQSSIYSNKAYINVSSIQPYNTLLSSYYYDNITTISAPSFVTQPVPKPKQYAEPIKSVNGFLSKHIIKWLSIEPIICSIAYHIHQMLPSRTDITVFESCTSFAYICHKLLPSASVVYANISHVNKILQPPTTLFGTNTFTSTKSLQAFDDHLPIVHPTFSINGADFTYKDPLPLPIPAPLPSSLKSILDIMLLLNLH